MKLTKRNIIISRIVICPTSFAILSKVWNSFSYIKRTSKPNIRFTGGNKTQNKLMIFLLTTGELIGKYKKHIIQ